MQIGLGAEVVGDMLLGFGNNRYVLFGSRGWVDGWMDGWMDVMCVMCV